MRAEKELQKQQVVRRVISGEVRYTQAAMELGVSPRTIQNYCRRFKERGLEGLRDRRRCNNRKLGPMEEAAIIAFRQARPQRSARLIRDRLGLNVSEEAVRLILVKHRLNRRAFLPLQRVDREPDSVALT